VCGHHHDQVSLDRAKDWCARSYSIFADLARDSATGVFLRRVTFYFRQPIADDARQRQKANELRAVVEQFRWDPRLISENGVNATLGFRDAYCHLAPMIDTDAYMHWLLAEVRGAGCRIVERKVVGQLREREEPLAREFGAQAIVNCTGLGAAELTGDRVSPLRGALVRVHNDGRSIPRITEAHCVSNDGSGKHRDFIFIVPRGDDMLVLGGLAEPDQWDLNIGLDNYEPVRAIYERCVEFLPALKGCAIDAAEPVRVGLRPVREQNVRLEREPGTRIIHNYGHGGSGVTFSWGCAHEVVARVAAIVGAN
jgi:D-amino-acid oxidase